MGGVLVERIYIKKDRVRAAHLNLSISFWPGLPGASLFLSSFNLAAGTAVQTQPIHSTSPFIRTSHSPTQGPHPGSLTSNSFLFLHTHNNNRTKSPSFSFHPPLKTALSVMPMSYEVWLREMLFAIVIVCRDGDRRKESAAGTKTKAQRKKACLKYISIHYFVTFLFYSENAINYATSSTTCTTSTTCLLDGQTALKTLSPWTITKLELGIQYPTNYFSN